MRFTTARHSLKEGFVSVVKHPLVSLATISTITLMLSVLGAFVIFSDNANRFAENASQQPPILVWADYDATEETIASIDAVLAADANIKNYTMQTPEENFEQFKADLGEDSKVLEGFDPSLLPYTFTVQLIDASLAGDFKATMEGTFGVRKVEYSQPVTEFLNKVRAAVNYITLLAFIVLCGVTLFIISNMVRIAVFSRAEEIAIMKYVGATNLYIRVPFIVEGSIVGFAGAALASIIVLVLYTVILRNFASAMNGVSFLNLVPLDMVLNKIIVLNLLIGILIGAGGSAVSVRRHIKV
ncbi:MAG: permease-like cell division protein FtsX [Saccharofermentanales bacterium]